MEARVDITSPAADQREVRAATVPVAYVLEPDGAVREGLHALLKQYGYAVATFVSAEDFLEHHEYRANSVVVAAVELPGMSGIDLLERLRQQNCPIPVIFLANEGSVSLTVRAMRAGASDFLEKPFFASALLKRIGDLVSR